MALKRKITKAEHEALSADLKTAYKAEGDSYVLDLDGGDDLAAAKQREVDARKAAEKKLKDAEEELETLKTEKNKKDGNIEALETSWKAKFDAEKTRADKAEGALNDERRNTHVTKEAERIAARFTVPDLVSEKIAKRLDVEIHDGKPIVRVLDDAGKPSALSVADLEKEFVDNPKFKSIVIASKATGGGAPKTPAAGGALPNNQSDQPKLLSAMTAKELAEHMKATPIEE